MLQLAQPLNVLVCFRRLVKVNTHGVCHMTFCSISFSNRAKTLADFLHFDPIDHGIMNIDRKARWALFHARMHPLSS